MFPKLWNRTRPVMERKNRPHRSRRWKIILPLVLGIVLMAVIYLQISYITFKEFEIEDCSDYSRGLTSLIAERIIDVEHIDDYIAQGRSYPGYNETEEKLYRLREAYPDVVYLYVYQVREDGCCFVFDLDTPEFKGCEPGTVEAFFPAFEPYIPDLLAGKEIPPVISNERFGVVLTTLTPVCDASGVCKCYIGADCSMEMLKNYSRKVIHEIIIFFGIVLIIILAVSLFATERGVIRKMNRLEHRAYRDTLTGLQNRTAYYEYVKVLNRRQEKGEADYTILMIDINFLKRVNDTYGHEQGNAYLKNSADLICRIFGEDSLYRIGGDEFVLILEGKKQEGTEQRIREFREEVERLQADESLQPWEKVSAAVGMAKFDPESDADAEAVFRRADETMYKNKAAMKASRT